MSVRCRFAPAPSGQLHVGGARTALFNWLFARHNGGVFILRIEDTDATRVTEESIGAVQDALRWLGLEWDEGPDVEGPFGPYRQTERLDIYRAVADDFLSRDHAYRCYCTPEELEERRKAAMARGEAPGYDGRCRTLTDDERRALEGRPAAIRFATPGHDVTVDDVIRGEAHFPAADIRDFVIMRSDGTPTYLLAAAVDDQRMELTHVIRGEDLLASTPRQMMIFEALGAEPPRYAHLPLIVGSDRQPLSKRHGAVAVESFRDDGFLPEALFNYLALLGWSPGEEEIIPRDELVARFELDGVQHHPAAFDAQKLEWMNGHYIRELDDADLSVRILDVLRAAGMTADEDTVRSATPLVKERMKTLSEAPGLLRFLFEDVAPNERADRVIAKAGPEHLERAASRLEAVEGWDVPHISEALDALAEDLGLSRSKAWQPIRAAVTGSDVSPPLPESLALLGKRRTLERLRRT
ncbi:MAG: glutamate--tRNA ligase [Actinomycetota bacterium]